jgi:hypothetical protein
MDKFLSQSCWWITFNGRQATKWDIWEIRVASHKQKKIESRVERRRLSYNKVVGPGGMATPLCSSFVVTVHQEVLNSWPKYETNYALHSCFFISLFLFLVPPLSFMKNTKMGQWSLKDVNDCKSDSPKNQTHPYVESLIW